MAWWGKLIGGAFGFMFGGPLGALLGSALGHQFDRGMGKLEGGPGVRIEDQERVQTAFFTAAFSVMGHIAKADGQVSRDEIDMAEHVMTQMQLTPEQRKTAIRLFNEGKSPDFPLRDVMVQFRKECHRRSTLLRMFLEIQIQAGFADGRLDPKERQVLNEIASYLGFPQAVFEQLLQLIEGMRREGTGRPTKRSAEDAYKVLGVSKDATDAEVKRAYRRLMNQHHPDKLVAKGLPEEMIKLATEKTQKIREAYERVRELRASV
ncbi:MAG: co-chaperone DjlA [Gammaproteobacteria bacterium]|nr:co-chaperone DjlA [Gammaproteobacteria bacterium]